MLLRAPVRAQATTRLSANTRVLITLGVELQRRGERRRRIVHIRFTTSGNANAAQATGAATGSA